MSDRIRISPPSILLDKNTKKYSLEIQNVSAGLLRISFQSTGNINLSHLKQNQVLSIASGLKAALDMEVNHEHTQPGIDQVSVFLDGVLTTTIQTLREQPLTQLVIPNMVDFGVLDAGQRLQDAPSSSFRKLFTITIPPSSGPFEISIETKESITAEPSKVMTTSQKSSYSFEIAIYPQAHGKFVDNFSLVLSNAVTLDVTRCTIQVIAFCILQAQLVLHPKSQTKISNEILDFGCVYFGETLCQSIQLQNTGPSSLLWVRILLASRIFFNFVKIGG